MQNESPLLQNPSLLVKSLVGCLNQLVEETPVGPESESVFNLRTAPTISISDYTTRMVKYMNASLSVYIYSLVLLDRAQEYNPQFIVHKRNVHRLLLVSNMVAAKYIDDLYYKNSFYATIGGVSLKVLNQLEMEFLNLINFSCHCEEATFRSYLDRLDTFSQVNKSDAKENILTKEAREAKAEKKERREVVRKTEEQLQTGSSKAEGERAKDELVKDQ